MEQPDVILIGAGIMSATLGVFLKELQPNISIEIFERLDQLKASMLFVMESRTRH